MKDCLQSHAAGTGTSGVFAGRVSEAAANACPIDAAISMDFRLVPDETPKGKGRRSAPHPSAMVYVLKGGRLADDASMAAR